MHLIAIPLLLAALWPQPREVHEPVRLPLRLPVQIMAPVELAGPTALLRRDILRLFGPTALADAGATVIRLGLAPSELPHVEEYTVTPGAGEVLLRAHDTQGAFWAVHTVAALLEQGRRTLGGYQVMIPRLRDWPDTPFRAFMIQGAWTSDLSDFRRNLDLLARQHITYVALEFGPQVVLDLDPKIAQGGRFTKAQTREVMNYARSLGLKPIGYLELLGHLERSYQKAPYTQYGGIDIRSEETYKKFVYPILSEMLEVYGPIEYFHCGMDEAFDLFSRLSRDGYDVANLLAHHVMRVDRFLKARGVRMVMWHDMLFSPDLQKQLAGPIGPANGGPPQNTASALAKIPRDVILDYWFYDPLAKYPALDYLRARGFEVWVSPWQTPFALVRYGQARNVSSMGTLWTGPPECFGSPTYSPVTAFYAQAAWNAAIFSNAPSPESVLTAAAQDATSAALWARHDLRFPGTEALLLSPAGPRRVTWPQAGDMEQHYGVPLSTAEPVRLKPLVGNDTPFAGTGATSVLLPGGVRLALDGVNVGRGEDQLILYSAPNSCSGTNHYGVEASVSAGGEVLEVVGYGASDHAIPGGGFVLSANWGPTAKKCGRLEALRVGARIVVRNARDEWLAGYSPTRLLAELSGGRTLSIDGHDSPRNEDQLVLYRPGYHDGHTGTNPFGTEVVVRADKVIARRNALGNTPIPEDGFVLSAHQGRSGKKVAALEDLKVGDTMRIVLEKGGRRFDLAEALAKRRLVYPVGARCSALYLAMRADASTLPGTPLGNWAVRYADGSATYLPIRYGREVLGPPPESLPQHTDDPVWLVDQPPQRFLVREWSNPHPARAIREVSFEPAPALLELGAQVLAATAAVAP
jgi:hypothetical protein